SRVGYLSKPGWLSHCGAGTIGSLTTNLESASTGCSAQASTSPFWAPREALVSMPAPIGPSVSRLALEGEHPPVLKAGRSLPHPDVRTRLPLRLQVLEAGLDLELGGVTSVAGRRWQVDPQPVLLSFPPRRGS